MFESNSSSEQILAFRLRASVLSGCLLFFSVYNVDLLLAAQTLVTFLFAQVRAVLGNPGYALSPHKASIPCWDEEDFCTGSGRTVVSEPQTTPEHLHSYSLIPLSHDTGNKQVSVLVLALGQGQSTTQSGTDQLYMLVSLVLKSFISPTCQEDFVCWSTCWTKRLLSNCLQTLRAIKANWNTAVIKHILHYTFLLSRNRKNLNDGSFPWTC